MTSRTPTIAVVIATRDRPTMLRGALEAVQSSRRRPDRLVVVDSASVSTTVGDVARQGGAELVRCELPGLGRARNAGLARVHEELVAFTDDDCLPEPDWIGNVIAAFDHPSRPAFVTGRSVADTVPEGRAQMMVVLTEDLSPRLLEGSDNPRQFGHGANMAWRVDVLRSIGNFDEAMGVGSLLRAGEDIDAFWRCTHDGATGYFDPNVSVVHRQWRTRRANLRSYWGYGVGIGAAAVKRYRMETAAGDAEARRGLRTRVIDEGLGSLVRSARQGREMGTVVDTLLLGGTMEGARLAWRLEVADGHFVVEPTRSIGRWRPS